MAHALPEGDLLQGVQPGPDGKINILTVFAHQDDESIYGGGAVLKAMKDPRVRLHILCMTFDQTSDAIKNLKITPDHSGKIRAKGAGIRGRGLRHGRRHPVHICLAGA